MRINAVRIPTITFEHLYGSIRARRPITNPLPELLCVLQKSKSLRSLKAISIYRSFDRSIEPPTDRINFLRRNVFFLLSYVRYIIHNFLFFFFKLILPLESDIIFKLISLTSWVIIYFASKLNFIFVPRYYVAVNKCNGEVDEHPRKNFQKGNSTVLFFFFYHQGGTLFAILEKDLALCEWSVASTAVRQWTNIGSTLHHTLCTFSSDPYCSTNKERLLRIE